MLNYSRPWEYSSEPKRCDLGTSSTYSEVKRGEEETYKKINKRDSFSYLLG